MASKDAPPPSTASETDRISALPDGVREHVLSFLPAHEAVRTSVLARSWRDLWMGSPKLRITAWGTVAKFSEFVSRLLRLRRGNRVSNRVSRQHSTGNRGVARAPLDSCVFHLSYVDFDFDGEDVNITKAMVTGWIQCALHCQVEVLWFCWSKLTDRLELHDQALASQHLTSLHLSGMVVTGNLDLSRCPALLDLTLDDSFLSPKEIWSPSLQHLSVTCCFFCLMNRTQIRVPSLVSLQFKNCEGMSPLLERMPLLATAVVRFDYYGYLRESVINVLIILFMVVTVSSVTVVNIITGLVITTKVACFSMVCQSLNTWSCQLLLRCRDIKNCPTFSNLKTLVLADWFVADDFGGLTGFLRHSPILEKLTLELSEVETNSAIKEATCKPLEQSVVSDHLKTVEIKCKEFNATVVKILKILAASRIPLEQINIQCSIRSG